MPVMAEAPTSSVTMLMLSRAPQGGQSLRQVCRNGDGQTKQILQLADGDDQGDSDREAFDDRFRYQRHQAASTKQAANDQDQSSDHCGKQQPVKSVASDHVVNHDDEGSGRAADLHPAATEQGDEKPGDDGRDQAGLGRRARGDGDRDAERQGDQCDGNTSQGVAEKHAP